MTTPVELDTIPGATAVCQLLLPECGMLYAQIKDNARFAREHMVGPAGAHKGETVIICGAGYSLAALVHDLPPADQIWGCNSALPYLVREGVKATHGFCIDQNDAMLDDWKDTFDVEYLLSSSVHPKLVKHLLDAGRNLSFFHSYLGIAEPEGWDAKAQGKSFEMALYTDESLFSTSVMVGYGLNSVPRAMCLAMHMGFDHILVYGADCAAAPDPPPMPEWNTPEYAVWTQGLQFYASGEHASWCCEQAVMAQAVIDGRRWITRGDLVISASHLLDMERRYPGRVVLMGDTLPAVLRDKDEEFMGGMPKLTGVGIVSGFGVPKYAEKVA